MHAAPRSLGRLASTRWVCPGRWCETSPRFHTSCISQRKADSNGVDDDFSITVSESSLTDLERRDGLQKGGQWSDPTRNDSNRGREPRPSLMEQLFPEEAKRMAAKKAAPPPEVPRLPLDELDGPLNGQANQMRRPLQSGDKASARARQARQDMIDQMQNDGVETRILVLRNASTNLAEEDFYRMVPRGKHMEDWRHEQGDIVKIIPARSMETLEQKPWYYLIFATQLSAFTYQGHVTRYHQIVQQQTPQTLTSPAPPPPGFLVNGIDAHTAIKDFTLLPAGQSLELHHLRPPLPPMIELIAKYQGYPALVLRPDKMPHELRLTLEGPQLSTMALKQAFAAAASHYDLLWSGNSQVLPKITTWTPLPAVSDSNRDSRSRKLAYAQLHPPESSDNERWSEEQSSTISNARRVPPKVWILGFHTEHAAQYFRQYWHMRSITPKAIGEGSASTVPRSQHDDTTIAKVERLW